MRHTIVLLLFAGSWLHAQIIPVQGSDTMPTARASINHNDAYLDSKQTWGTALPPNCNMGQLFFKTNAPPGQNTYVALANGTPCTTWTLQAGAPADWNSITGKPSTFPPSTHAATHASGQADAVTPGAIGAEVPLSFSAPLVRTVNTVTCPTCGSGLIGSGTASLGTSAIASGACGAAVTVAAAGVAATDVITASFNSDPTGVVGYQPSANGMLTVIPYPSAGNINFKVCNNTAAAITPGAITLNWRVAR